MMMSGNCLVCDRQLQNSGNQGLDYYFDCDTCGKYSTDTKTLWGIQNTQNSPEYQKLKPKLCSKIYYHNLYHQTRYFITWEAVEALKTENTSPAQILNRLIEFLYEEQYQLNSFRWQDYFLFPVLQSFDRNVQEEYFRELEKQDIIKQFQTLSEYHPSNPRLPTRLNFVQGNAKNSNASSFNDKPYLKDLQFFQGVRTLKGFEVYEELKKGKSKSNQVFMALQYDNELAANFYKNFLTPALKEFKLDLKDLRDSSKIGSLLVAQMEAEIRQSKFLIADITPVDGKHNANVYWEAGLARGLDKPVLYLCEASKFKKLPFDTNGFLHVKYDLSSEEKVKDAIKEIQAKIYNTFPNELVLPDNKVS
jgi:hypothetical protein